MNDDEERAALQAEHPELSAASIELTLCCLFSSEICKKLASPSDWIRDPRTLLSDLGHLERWRSKIISGDPRKCEKFTIHREKYTLFMELRSVMQRIVRELRAVQPVTRIPVSADRLETVWHNLEDVENATDDGSDTTQTAAYTVWRLLKDEIITLEVFCRLTYGETLRIATFLPFGLQRCDVPQYLKREGYNPVQIENADYWDLMEALMEAAPNAVPDTKLKQLFPHKNDRDNAPKKLRDIIDSLGLTVKNWALMELKN